MALAVGDSVRRVSSRTISHSVRLPDMKPKLVIAGATGFIGRWFIERYKHKYQIVALSRRKAIPDTTNAEVTWRQVELYSLSQTTTALKDADYALYLVHSMQPTTRLSQGTFDDTDVLLADNFARAAEANQLKQVLFLGGILPRGDMAYSRHLRSRYEVEKTLSSGSVPLTALRAGIIVGPGGSSFRIMEKLVRRLPAMICPSWTKSSSSPVALRDMLQMIDYCLGRPDMYDQAFDVGGSDVLTYVDMMRTVADLMQKKRLITTVPFFTPGLSKLWVATFADSSRTLVSPLIESLRYDLPVSDNKLLEQFPNRNSFRESAERALFEKDTVPALPKFEDRKPLPNERNTVRSVQRLPNPNDRSAIWVARRYQTWLPRFFRYLIKVDLQGENSVFRIGSLELLRFRFIEDRSDQDRQLFYIVGGRLVKRRDYGWLEFRRVLDGRYVIAAIHEFVPTLPWFIYVLTQAIVHLWVMDRFGKYLDRLEV